MLDTVKKVHAGYSGIHKVEKIISNSGVENFWRFYRAALALVEG